MFERWSLTADWWHIVAWRNHVLCDWLGSDASAESLLDTGQIWSLAPQRSNLLLCFKTVLIDAICHDFLFGYLIYLHCERRSTLSPIQLHSRQTIYDGPATIELQSFSAFPICFDALDFQTRLGVGKRGWERGGAADWINLSHGGGMAPESFGYSINHLSFTCCLPSLAHHLS